MHDTRGRPYVYLVGADNRIKEQPIATGQMIGHKWLVNSGLKSGDRVVVNGLQTVQAGTRVTTTASTRGSSHASNVNLTTTDASAQ